jgi:hypothetical protein
MTAQTANCECQTLPLVCATASTVNNRPTRATHVIALPRTEASTLNRRTIAAAQIQASGQYPVRRERGRSWGPAFGVATEARLGGASGVRSNGIQALGHLGAHDRGPRPPSPAVGIMTVLLRS